ncbi:30S ribosomal protein S3 [Patescibacteria group bacterium]|nr:30S ribosomal protein S3 [Patescibacteria group bacterium]MBU4512670.1 30S ribosomal protein S3 [Patescibacteria group bacterium]MCG2693574.1 30S ribosomal protein S3 [Candidatus Parcubacteria bacterium]
MGQKVNPKAYRIAVIKTWDSKWFSNKEFKNFLREDVMLRKLIYEKLKKSGVAKIEIERSPEDIKVIVEAAKPGLIIGRGGAGIEQLKKEIQKKVFNKIYTKRPKSKYKLDIVIQEVKEPYLQAQILLEEIIGDIEKRIRYRRVMKQSIEKVKKAGAKGVKVIASGRLDGVSIARTETLTWGSLPLHTLRADIDYSRGVARTIYGAVGVKVWIYKGEVFKEKRGAEAKAEGKEEK